MLPRLCSLFATPALRAADTLATPFADVDADDAADDVT